MTDLSTYRTPTGLLIPPLTWKGLRGSTPEDALSGALCAAMEGMPMPDADISEARALSAFRDLRGTSMRGLLAPGRITLLRCPSAPQPEYHTRLRPPGNMASNYFFHRLRLRTPKAGAPSAWEKWHDPEMRLRVCRRFLKLSAIDRVDNASVRRALHMTGATPVQFKPGVAKAIYELTQAKRILDLSMGWGDRLAGFCACSGTTHYTGIDPNPDLHPLYLQQTALYGAGKQVSFLCLPAEEMPAPPAEWFDLVFTSPPYLDTERYAAGTGHEAAQSWTRYPDPEQWRDRFLRPSLERAWIALQAGGVLAINIADVTQRGVRHPLCEWTQAIVAALPGATFQFALGMRLQGANYSDERRSAIAGEPIWIWSKGPRDLPRILFGLGPQRSSTVLPAPPIEPRRRAWWTKPGHRGSPPTDPAVVALILAAKEGGESAPTVGKRHSVSKTTVRKIWARAVAK